MGNRGAKPPPGTTTNSSKGLFGRKKKAKTPTHFPVLTPQSYVPGSAGAATGVGPYAGFVPPTGTGPMAPANPMRPPYPMPYPQNNQMSMMQQQGQFSRPPYPSYPQNYNGQYPSRPIIHIVESSSCSSISTCSTISLCSSDSDRVICRCSKHRRARRCRQPQQQPIILLPIQTQSSALPTIGVQQQQPLALPSIVQINPNSGIIGNPSQLQTISIQPLSSMGAQHVLVRAGNKNQSNDLKPIRRSASLDGIPKIKTSIKDSE